MEHKQNVLDNSAYLLYIIQEIRKVTGLKNTVMLKDLPKEIEKILFRNKLTERTLKLQRKKLKRQIFDKDNLQ